MANKKIRTCQMCKSPFQARRDAKTCSPACRKRLQRRLQVQATERAQRLESVLGQEFHRLTAELMKQHVLHRPLVLADERGAVAVPDLTAHDTTLDELQPSVQPMAVAEPPAAESLEAPVSAPVAPIEPVMAPVEPVAEPPVESPATSIPVNVVPTSTEPITDPIPEPSQPIAAPVVEPVMEPSPEPVETAPTSVASVGTAADVLPVSVADTSDESLEAPPDMGAPLGAAEEPPMDTPKRARTFSPFGLNRAALLVTSFAMAVIAIIGIGSFTLLGKQHVQTPQSASQKVANYGVGKDLPLGNVSPPSLQVGQANNVSINGQLKVANTLVLEPEKTPNKPIRGQIYYDQASNAPFYYNGSQFISLAPQQQQSGVDSLGGAQGNIAIGNGLSINNNQLSISNALQQQITNATSQTAGVLSLTGTPNQISVSSSTGKITLSLPQSIAVSSTPTFGGLTVNGTLSVATVQQAAAGNNLNINAGSDNISFVAGGRTFIFPTSGPASQTICTTGITCASGGGQAVLLQPGSAQTDSGSGPSVFFNNTGGGRLLELQAAGVDSFVVSNAGNVTTAGTYNGQTISSATNFTGTVAIQGANSLTLGTSSNVGSITFRDGSSSFTGTLKLQGTMSGAATYNLPTATGTQTICTAEAGNCAGTGGGVTTPGGTVGALAYFSGTQQIASSILSQSASTLTAAGNLVVNAANGFSGNLLNLEVNGSSKLTIDQSGDSIQAGTLTANGTGASAIAGSLSVGTGLTVTTGGATITGATSITGNGTITGTLAVQGPNALTLGSASGNTGAIIFKGSGGNGTLTLQGPTTPNVGNYTLSIPAIAANDTICTNSTQAAACPNYAPASGSNNYIINGTSLQTADFNISGTGKAGTLNATGAIQLNGVNINTAGTLSNVAYLNQANSFSATNTFSAAGTGLSVTHNLAVGGNINGASISGGTLSGGNVSGGTLTASAVNGLNVSSIALGATGALSISSGGSSALTLTSASGDITTGSTINGQTISSSANFTGTLAVQGVGGLTVGKSGVVDGVINLANASNSNLSAIKAAAPTGSGTATYILPSIAGGTNDTICTQTTGCTTSGSAGGDLTGSYPNPTIAKLQGATLTLGTEASGDILQYNGSAWVNNAVSGDITIDGSGVTTIGNGKVTNAKLQNSSLSVTAGAGLSGGGSVSLGGSTSLAVVYGSGINTAVQGSTTLTCASGTGNLSGGGNTITLGSGGSCNNISIANSPTFSGTLTVQGSGGITVGTTGVDGTLKLTNSSNSNLSLLQSAAPSGVGNATYTLPSIVGGTSDELCLKNLGNCAGSGGGITGSGTAGTIAVFTGSGSIGDSVLSQSGSAVTLAGTLAVTGANSLSLGSAGGNTGSVSLYNSTNSNALTLQAGATGANLTFTLPTSYGSSNQCLKTNGSGTLSFQDCTGGAGGGVTSLNSLVGVLTVQGTANQVNVTDNGTDTITLSLPQSIATTSSPVFASPNATTGVNTGAGAGTQRIDASGNLVNIGTISASGAINGATISGGSLSGTAVNNLNVSGTTISGTGALTVDANGANTVSIGGISTGDILLGGGNGSSGCTVTNSTGALTCDGNIVSSSGNVNASAGSIQTGGTTRINNAGNLVNIGTITTSGAINGQTISSAANFTGTVTIQGANALVLGTSTGNTGAITFYNSLGTHTITLQGPAADTAANYTLAIPTLTDNSTICVAYAGGGGNCVAAGSAGGDLTGTYPNPTIAKLQGTTLTLSSLASGDVLQYNGSAIVNGKITNSNLAAGNFSSIQGTGTLTSGQIGSGFGPISTASNISTTATLHSDTLTAGSSNQFQVDSSGNLTVSNTASILGSSGLMLGNAGSTDGVLSFANSTNTNLTVVQAAAPSGTGNASISIPSITGGTSDEVCLKALQNCVGSGGGVTTPGGTTGALAYFTGSQTIASSIVSQGGTTLTLAGNQIVNAGAGFTGNLLNLEVNSSSKLSVDQAGSTIQAGTLNVNGTGASSIAGTLTVGGITTLSTLGSGDTSTLLCRNSSDQIATCSGSSSGSPFIQGGNSFGATGVLGTNDNNGLNIRTNGTTVASLSSTGSAVFQNSTDSTAAFQIQNAAGDSLLTADTVNNIISVDRGPLSVLGLDAPSAPSLISSGTGGSLPAATYQYRLGVIYPGPLYSSTTDSSPQSVTTTGSSSKNTLTWSAVHGAIGYTLYRSTDGGTTFYRNTLGNVTSAVDDGTSFTWSGSNYATQSGLNDTSGLYLRDGGSILFDGAGPYNVLIWEDHNTQNLNIGNYNLGKSINLNVAAVTDGSGITSTYRPVALQGNYTATDIASGVVGWSGLNTSITYGNGGVASTGTVHALTADTVVQGNGNALDEHAGLVANLRYDIGTGYAQTSGPTGRGWLTDFNVHGPIGTQPNLLNGINMFINNYYNGSPLDGPSAGQWIVTKKGAGGGNDSLHAAANTYAVDVGLGIVGKSNVGGVDGVGFTKAIQIGGYGSGWMQSGNSLIGTGIDMQDYLNYGLYIHDRAASGTGPAIAVSSNAGNVVIGATSSGSANLDVEGTSLVKTTSATAFQVQNGSGNSVLTADTSNNQVTLGKASTLTGKLAFYNSAGANTITLQGPAANPGGNYTLTIPTLTGNDTICVQTLANCSYSGTAASGDLTGTYPSPTIAKLQGTTLTLSSLASGDVLQYNGSAIVNGHITNSNLTAGSFSNITGVGTLGSLTVGSGSSFFTVNSTGAVTATTGITGSVTTTNASGTNLHTSLSITANPGSAPAAQTDYVGIRSTSSLYRQLTCRLYPQSTNHN